MLSLEFWHGNRKFPSDTEFAALLLHSYSSLIGFGRGRILTKDVSLWSRCIIETICSDTLPSVYTASNPILLYIRVFIGFSGSTMLILGQTCINQRRHRNKSTEKVTCGFWFPGPACLLGKAIAVGPGK